jgi:hypothetical protein
MLLAGDKARPAQGSFRFRLDKAEVLVSFTSEAARVDLNFASKEMLANLFAVLGADQRVSQEAAERIVGYDFLKQRPALPRDQSAIAAALGPAQANAALPKSKSFRVLTSLRFDNGRRTSSEVVIALGEDKDKDKDPHQVVSWQDDVEAGHRPRKLAGG